VSRAADIAEALKGRKNGEGWLAHCICHDDHTPSLAISESPDGKTLVFCHAGCPQEAVIEELRRRGLWPDTNRTNGFTVAALAADKSLPETLLRDSGFSDDQWKGHSVVCIRYRGPDSSVICTRYRSAGNGERRFWFRRGDKQQLFGLWRLRPEPVIVVEGETDAVALWDAGFNAIGVPGAKAWSVRNDRRFAAALESCPTIYVHIEPDEGGETFRKSFKWSALHARVKFFTCPPDAKDPCELHQRNPQGFRAAIEQLLRDAKPTETEPSSDAGRQHAGAGSKNGEAGTGAPDIKAVHERIAGLAKLCRIEYDRIRVAEADALGIRVSTLDAEVAKLYPSDIGPGLAFTDPEPWPETVDGAALLEELHGTIERYVVLPAHAAVALALWILHAWAHDAFYASPYVLIRSPGKRCGKSTLLTILRSLVRRPLIATSASTAAVYRAIEQYRPTFMLDEVDVWMRENEEMRAVLCGGHTRSTAHVVRVVGDNHQPQRFSTFCPKVFAGIGGLADTLEDRSIILSMKRKRPTDTVARLREDQYERDMAPTQSRCRRWAEDQLETLRRADPCVPPALNDRAADNWRPLLAIADLAGGVWPSRGREAAIALSGQTDDEAAGVQLLADIRDIYIKEGCDRLESAVLVESLGAMEERPWAECGKQGKPITAPQLARLLRPFGIAPRNIAIDALRHKGYLREQFEDAFSRYLPDPSQSAAGDQEAF